MKSGLLPFALLFLPFINALGMGSALAAGYPTRPVRVISQAPVGIAGDIVSRLVTNELARAWNQSVVVDNRPGAGGIVAAQLAAKAPPDGYTLFAAASSAFVVTSAAHRDLTYSPNRDFLPIGFVAEIPFVIAVAQSVPARTVPELIAAAAKEPGKIHYAAAVPGSFPNLAGELFADRAGVNLTYVPYKSTPQALQDIVGGRISAIVEGIAGLSGALKSGMLRPIAVTSRARLSNFPDIPSVSDTLPNFEAVGWFALVAPDGTPRAVTRKISEDLGRAVAQPQIRTKMEELGTYPRPMTPDELASFIRREQDTWAPIVKRMGFKPQ